MFNITRDTKDIYIGKAMNNKPIRQPKSNTQNKTDDEDTPKPIKLIPKETALKIQRKRQEMKMTQKELALKINKNVSVIQEIETGQAKYDRGLLNKIGRVLNITL